MNDPRPAVDGRGLSAVEVAAMHRAIELAGLGAGTALPNPVVGCVILAPSGEVVGTGYHERPGGPHAEVNALDAAGPNARGGTAVVSLEPCAHTGRTGPCADALIHAGVARVVLAVPDPWPPAAGGADRLRAAGIEVAMAGGELADRAEDVNRVWLASMRTHRPFVTVKGGVTVDGRVAAPDGTSRWITSAESRADVHWQRAVADTIMVGAGTVLADDPQLTVRDAVGAPVGRQPLRVIVTGRRQLPAGVRVLDGSVETLVATPQEIGRAPGGGVELAALLSRLYAAGRRHVLVEGGPTLATALLDAGLVDEIVLYVAPTVLGAGSSMFGGGTVATLADARHGELREVARFGPDVRLRYRLS